MPSDQHLSRDCNSVELRYLRELRAVDHVLPTIEDPTDEHAKDPSDAHDSFDLEPCLHPKVDLLDVALNLQRAVTRIDRDLWVRAGPFSPSPYAKEGC